MKIEIDLGERYECGDCPMSTRDTAWPSCAKGHLITRLERKRLDGGVCVSSWNAIRPESCVKEFGA